MGLDYINFLSKVETVEKERESWQNIKTTLIVKLSHQEKLSIFLKSISLLVSSNLQVTGTVGSATSMQESKYEGI